MPAFCAVALEKLGKKEKKKKKECIYVFLQQKSGPHSELFSALLFQFVGLREKLFGPGGYSMKDKIKCVSIWGFCLAVAYSLTSSMI